MSTLLRLKQSFQGPLLKCQPCVAQTLPVTCSRGGGTCFFARLTEEQFDLLLPYVRERTYAVGTPVVHQGDDIDGVYFVLEGRLKATRVTAAGEQVLLRLLLPGDSFPLTGIVEGGEHPGTIQAASPARVAWIRRTDLLRLATQRGDLAVHLIRELGQNISRLDERLSDLSLLPLPGRIAALLLRLTRGEGAHPGEPAAAVRLTHAEIASLVGSCRETVTRILAEFRRWGWIGVARGDLVVLDPVALSARLERESAS